MITKTFYHVAQVAFLSRALLPMLCCADAPGSQKPDPNAIPSVAGLKARMKSELRVTKPDYIVFVPEVTDERVSDTGNEHFLVFDGPDGSLMAVWTQSTHEGQPDQHIVFAQSRDEGETWTKPRIIAGPAKAGEGLMASWAFPLVSKSGRIYVLYSQNVGKFDTFPHTTGRLDGIFSDDNGRRWSKPQTVPIPRTSRDNPDTSFPGNWICWQKPLRLTKDGRYYAGITRWTSKAVKTNPTKSWISHDSAVEFMRFDNVDENPEVAQINVLFIHNHDGHYKNYGPTDTSFHRRPIYLVPGRYQAGAQQPVWFDEPNFFMDHGGVTLGKPGTRGRLDLAFYSSFTVRDGKAVLWYPDRKFFLLGRVITNEWFRP